MKSLATLIIVLLFFLPVLGQSKKQSKRIPPPPPPSLSDFGNIATSRNGTPKYTLKTRLSFYPFNVAKQIKLVSFDKNTTREVLSITSIVPNDTLEQIAYIDDYGLPFQDDNIDFTKMVQITALNKQAVDSLSDILYNTCSRWMLTETIKSGCYYPHNAIIFFDAQNQPFEYIELCFDCNQLKYSSKKIKQFDDCDIALRELESYFKSFGLKTSKEAFEK